MRFSQKPTESKKNINKAGQILAKEDVPGDFDWALSLVNQWRACHAYPINTFQATLRTKLRKSYPEGFIVAQRLKRMPTIIDKLKRYQNMQLTTMQDIGGVRAIMPSMEDVKKLASEYKERSRFAHELVDERNYIQNPRDQDGYRSLHLIYRYKNKMNPSYDDLRIELQIRTRLQHAWATAVETMGTILAQGLKSRQGDKDWLDFFAVISSAFAHQENTPPIPRFSFLSPSETVLDIARRNNELDALNKMRSISAVINDIPEKNQKWSYHLIVLNSKEGTVSVTPYDRESIDKAIVDYADLEKQVKEGKKIEPVLVSAGPIDILRNAYPNFFLDISEFVASVTGIIEENRWARRMEL